MKPRGLRCIREICLEEEKKRQKASRPSPQCTHGVHVTHVYYILTLLLCTDWVGLCVAPRFISLFCFILDRH